MPALISGVGNGDASVSDRHCCDRVEIGTERAVQHSGVPPMEGRKWYAGGRFGNMPGKGRDGNAEFIFSGNMQDRDFYDLCQGGHLFQAK